MSRTNGRLVMLDSHGRHVSGTADAAFSTGLTGLDANRACDDEPFAGVPPIDTVIGRHPADALRPAPESGAHTEAARSLGRRPPPRRPGRHRPPDRRTTTPTGHPGDAGGPAHRRAGRRTAFDRPPEATAQRQSVRVSAALYPDGEPSLAGSLQERHDRMDLRYAIGVLMGNRDAARRMTAEGRVPWVTGM